MGLRPIPCIIAEPFRPSFSSSSKIKTDVAIDPSTTESGAMWGQPRAVSWPWAAAVADRLAVEPVMALSVSHGLGLGAGALACEIGDEVGATGAGTATLDAMPSEIVAATTAMLRTRPNITVSQSDPDPNPSRAKLHAG